MQLMSSCHSGSFQMAVAAPNMELLELVEEPARTCGHDAAKHGGCKGKPVDKVKAKDCPIGLKIKEVRGDNKRKADVLKKTKQKAAKAAKAAGGGRYNPLTYTVVQDSAADYQERLVLHLLASLGVIICACSSGGRRRQPAVHRLLLLRQPAAWSAQLVRRSDRCLSQLVLLQLGQMQSLFRLQLSLKLEQQLGGATTR